VELHRGAIGRRSTVERVRCFPRAVADCVPKPARRVAHGSSRVGRTSVPGDSAVIVINAHAARLDMLGLEETGSSDSMWSAKSRCCRSDLRTSTEGRNLSHSWSR